jgi:hypothetical protein
MAQRSITSPGVEISELDHSLTSRPIGSTDILITGFADQGPTEEFTMVGGITEYEQVFGTPTNSAERYLYYTAKQILLSSPANLMVSRLPYGSNSGEGYANSYSALVYPVVNNGVGTDVLGLTGLTLTLGGSGYKTAPSIEFIGGGLNGSSPISKAKAVANIVPLSLSAVPALSSVAGSITSIKITDHGFGYYTLPTITITGGGYSRIAEINTGSLGVVETVTQDYDTATSYKIGEPTSILLTDEEYNQLLQNDIEWQTGYTPSITSFADIGKAGLVVLNDTKTSINNKYEGYYVALADNKTFNPSTDFVCVTGIKTVTSNNDLSQTLTVVPKSRLNFTLSQTASSFGSDSISKVIEQYPTDVDLIAKGGTNVYSDTLVLVVFKIASSQTSTDTLHLNYVISEGYAGSLNSNRTQLNVNGGTPTSFFLDTVVNNNSSRIKVLTNPNISQSSGWTDIDGNTAKTVNVDVAARNLYASGVHTSNTDKVAKDVGNVPAKLQRVINKLENNDTINIDVVCEAGLGSIWASANVRSQDPSYSGKPVIFDENYNYTLGDLASLNDGSIPTGTAYTSYHDIANLFVTLAGGTRKDHIFIADPLRNIFIKGASTKVSSSTSFSFQDSIWWPLRNLYSGLVSSYATTYGNWIKTGDAYTNTQVWVPASGYAAAVMASVSQQAYPWIAPAGFNRGTLNNVSDLAINPTQKQRDQLYKTNINPIAYFNNDGFVIYGQKTLLNNPSAFDRINVRRLFLTLEKETKALLRYFVFEPNSFSTQNRLKGALIPIFDQAKLNDGLYDYLLICDATNNTPNVIDNNELRISIYIQPVRAAEFILADFIATTTGVSFSVVNG